MNKLSIVNYSTELTTVEKSALLAFDKPKISVLTKIDMVDQLSDAIARGYVNLNQSADKNDPKNALLVQRQMVSSLINDLKDSFGTFSIEEVCIAIEMGSKGKLNNLTEIVQPVMSLTNILAWIWLYRDKFRREAIHKQRQYEEKLAKELEESLKESKVKDFESVIIGIYQGFPESFKMQNKGSLAAMYRHLDKRGLIMLSEHVKWEIYKGIQKIKERTKFSRKGFLEITAKELSEYRALKQVFKDWKEFDYDLKSELQTEGDKRK